ncbi:MAG: 4-oxalocrotonate tautomerase [Chloroflexi bacterium]|jgi:4-oxalocrotonate tautomerase|nr:MAG: 4-oxalocrotonate tautomerase [Chloroflexota bacterium]
MPIIKMELWPGRTTEQKAKLAEAFTKSVEEIIGTAPENTIVLFQDISKDDWAKGGKLASES